MKKEKNFSKTQLTTIIEESDFNEFGENDFDKYDNKSRLEPINELILQLDELLNNENQTPQNYIKIPAEIQQSEIQSNSATRLAQLIEELNQVEKNLAEIQAKNILMNNDRYQEIQPNPELNLELAEIQAKNVLINNSDYQEIHSNPELNLELIDQNLEKIIDSVKQQDSEQKLLGYIELLHTDLSKTFDFNSYLNNFIKGLLIEKMNKENNSLEKNNTSETKDGDMVSTNSIDNLPFVTFPNNKQTLNQSSQPNNTVNISRVQTNSTQLNSKNGILKN